MGLSTHGWKVNFCKFTNETRNGLKSLATVTGACAGGGYLKADIRPRRTRR